MFKTFSKPKMVETGNSPDAKPQPVEEHHKNPEINKAIKYFLQICKHRQVDAIDRHDFKMLVCKLVMESGSGVSIYEKDIEEAFILADEDNGGTVDKNEFVHLYEMVLADEIKGLHLAKVDEQSRATNRVKKASFKEKLNEKRDDQQAAFWRSKADEHERQVMELFEQIDTDHSGGIDINELREAAPLLKITEAEAIDLFNNFEIDENGLIGLEEFRDHYSYETMEDELKKFSSRAREAVKSEAKEVFTKIDVARTGHIMQKDFREAAAKLDLTPDEADAIFYEMDVDGNGDIDMDEFYEKYTAYKKKVELINKRKAEYKSGVEDELKMNQDYRNTVGEELSNAKSEWQKRQKAEAMKKKLIQDRIQERKKRDEMERMQKESPMNPAKHEQEKILREKQLAHAAATQKENERLRAERVKKCPDVKTRDLQFEKEFQTKLKKAEAERLKNIAGYKPKAWLTMFGGFVKTSSSEPPSPRSPLPGPKSSSSPRSRSPKSPRSGSGWKSPFKGLTGSSSKKSPGSAAASPSSGKKARPGALSIPNEEADESQLSSTQRNKNPSSPTAEDSEKKRARINDQRKKVEDIKSSREKRHAEEKVNIVEQVEKVKAVTANEEDMSGAAGGKGGSFSEKKAKTSNGNTNASSTEAVDLDGDDAATQPPSPESNQSEEVAATSAASGDDQVSDGVAEKQGDNVDLDEAVPESNEGKGISL